MDHGLTGKGLARRVPFLDVLAALFAAVGITLSCVALIDGTLYGRFLVSLLYR